MLSGFLSRQMSRAVIGTVPGFYSPYVFGTLTADFSDIKTWDYMTTLMRLETSMDAVMLRVMHAPHVGGTGGGHVRTRT
jgi:hypothetical protein